jgi:hypothetical protein
MANYALVENGVVQNTIVWDGNTETWQPPSDMIAVPIPEGAVVDIGGKYSDGEFLPPS